MISINSSLLTKFKQKLATIKTPHPSILPTTDNSLENQYDRQFFNGSFNSGTEIEDAMTSKLKQKIQEYKNKNQNIYNYMVIQSDDEQLTNPSEKPSLDKAVVEVKLKQVGNNVMELNKNQESTEIVHSFEKIGEKKQNEKVLHGLCESYQRQQKNLFIAEKHTQFKPCSTLEKESVQKHQQVPEIVCEELNQQRQQNCPYYQQVRGKSKSSFKTMPFQQVAKIVQLPCYNQGTIYPFMINNLLEVYSKIPSKVVKLYMLEIAQKYKIHFNKLMVSFCIQAIIAKFYETHQIDCLVSGKYFFSELEQFLPTFMVQVNICQWATILEICQGLSTRFDIKNSFEEEWLITTIRKKKTFLRENLVNVEQILIASRTKQRPQINADSQEPTISDYHYHRYAGIEEYLSRQNKTRSIQLQLPNYDIALDKSDKKGVSNRLTYYQKLKEKLQSSKATQKISSNDTKLKDNKHDVDSSPQPIQFDIIKYCSKFNHDLEILSYFQEDYEENLAHLDRQMSNKKEKMKQKEKEKELERKKKGEGMKKNQNHHVSKSVKVDIEIDIESFIENCENSGTNSEKGKQKQAKTASKPKTSSNLIETTSKQKQMSAPKNKLPIPNLKSESDKKQEILDFEKELMKIDEIVFKYYEENMSSQPSIAGISQRIKQFLNQNKIPEKYHDKLLQKWFAKYSD